MTALGALLRRLKAQFAHVSPHIGKRKIHTCHDNCVYCLLKHSQFHVKLEYQPVTKCPPAQNLLQKDNIKRNKLLVVFHFGGLLIELPLFNTEPEISIVK